MSQTNPAGEPTLEPTSQPLPGPLKSVYRQYKQDTNFVASWLAITAKRCGYPTDLLSETTDGSNPGASRPKATGGKGKKKKPNKKPTKPAGSTTNGPKKYTVAVNEYIPLAQFICNSKKDVAAVPEWFVTAINRVIHVRKEFRDRLAALGRKTEQESDMKHNYFVGILEKVREVLRPLMTAEAAHASDVGLSNKFEGLTVSEPSQEFIDAPDVEKPKVDVVYEAEENMSDDEAMFIISLLWQDLLKTRFTVKALWFSYCCKDYELPAVAVATNTAFDLARHMIQEVFPVLETHEKGFYGILKNNHALLWDWVTIAGPKEAEQIDLSLNPSTEEKRYVAGKESYMNAYNMLADILPSLQADGKPIGPILPIDGEFTAKKGNARFDKDYNYLKQIFEDLMFINEHIAQRSTSHSRNWPHVIEDALMRGLRETLQTRRIPFYLVFASQVMIDVHHELDDSDEISMPKDEMLNKMNIMYDMWAHYHRVHDSAGTYDDLEEIDTEIRTVALGCLQMKDDPIYEQKMKLLKKKKGQTAGPKPEKHGFWKRHPVACGLLLYVYQLAVYKAGIHVSNVTRSIAASMHMYNAFLSEGLIKDPWPDMECAKTFFGPGNFFVGRLPTSMDDYAKAIMLQLGLSVVSVMDPSKRRGNTRSRMLQDVPNRMLKWDVPTWMAFDTRYLDKLGKTAEDTWTAEDVYSIIADFMKKAGGPSSIVEGKKKPAKSKTKSAKEVDRQPGKKPQGDSLKTHDLVIWLCRALTSEYSQISFPFVVLHAYAWFMMRYMREDCESLVKNVLGPPDGKLKEYALPCCAAHILQAAYVVPHWAQSRLIMEQAAKTFQECLFSRLMMQEPGGSRSVPATTGDDRINWICGEAALMFVKRQQHLPPWWSASQGIRTQKGDDGEWELTKME
ncbi:hypothetical protein CkaCkLH20_00675 [Colletotrichum karsti]|uniref:DUF6604 domain-containing protein n=1 Tax=Colletotrichum karsti TaxID=1095194 RepID=A0A9P6IFL1_9PEZI|nr:uncharacterized protein CkaCkLH20_00675 [Colletotrichum karsti]KAF9881529.1 hypothetical protein CkaCkLH20_00675 [Colletotrichum karsti]